MRAGKVGSGGLRQLPNEKSWLLVVGIADLLDSSMNMVEGAKGIQQKPAASAADVKEGSTYPEDKNRQTGRRVGCC